MPLPHGCLDLLGSEVIACLEGLKHSSSPCVCKSPLSGTSVCLPAPTSHCGVLPGDPFLAYILGCLGRPSVLSVAALATAVPLFGHFGLSSPCCPDFRKCRVFLLVFLQNGSKSVLSMARCRSGRSGAERTKHPWCESHVATWTRGPEKHGVRQNAKAS